MSEKTKVEQTVERIKAMDWNLKGDILTSMKLFEEYLRRLALWLNSLNVVDRWSLAFVLDIPSLINPSIRADQNMIQEVKLHLAKFRPFTVVTCELAVHWAALEDSMTITQFNLPSPYEPLLLMYERGTEFRIENNFFDLSGILLPRRGWNYYNRVIPFIELNDSKPA